MCVAAIAAPAAGAAGHDLRRAGDNVPERHLFPYVPPVGVRGIERHDRCVVVAIDVERGRQGNQRIALLRRLEGGEDATLGCAEADDPCGAIVGWKWQKEMSVDRQLRPLLLEEVERRLRA